VSVHDRLRQFGQRHPRAGLATVAVVFVVTLVTTRAGPASPPLDLGALALAAVASGVLLVRRRWPLAVLLVSTLAAEAYLVHYGGHRGEMVLVAPLIALYTVAEASAGGRRRLVIAVLGVLAFAGLHMLAKPSSPLGADNLALAALGGLAVAAGEGSRIRRAYHSEVEQRALRAESEREAEAARQVTEERLRIARDLHDAVGHQLAVIHVQAGVVAHLLEAPSPRTAEALSHIRTASRTALAELNETIGLLRQPGDVAALEPVPGLAGLDDLLASFRRAGLTITEQTTGTPRPLPPLADVTVYRLVQESLTNVCRHVGPTKVQLTLAFGPGDLRVTIHNGVTRASDIAPLYPTGGARHGTDGMRERVNAAGGHFEAGHRRDGGYRVAAVLPLVPVTS